jgi:hypothetical protein
MLGGAVATGGSAALMGALLTAVLVGTTLALVLGSERERFRPVPFVALRSASKRERAAAA